MAHRNGVAEPEDRAAAKDNGERLHRDGLAVGLILVFGFVLVWKPGVGADRSRQRGLPGEVFGHRAIIQMRIWKENAEPISKS